MPDPVQDVAIRRPSPALAPYIERYIGYRMSGFPAGIHRGLPSRLLTFIISLDGPVEMLPPVGADARPVGRTSVTSMDAFVGGLDLCMTPIRHNGRQHGIAIELTPLGAGVVLGVPAGALVREVVPLTALLGARGRELIGRLHDAAGWPAKFAVLDAVLGRTLHERFAPAAEVAHAWSLLHDSPDGLDVARLAREVGWSRRTLSQRLRQDIGYPPRQLDRLFRFGRSRSLIQRGHLPTLTDVALQAGYFDHAHLVHEWQKLAGCTPTEWLAEVLPPVQDEQPAPDQY